MRKVIFIILILTFLFEPYFGSSLVNAVTCSPPSLTPPNNTCSVQQDVTITATVPDSTVTFSGVAPASSTVTFKDNGTVAGTGITNGSGQFNKTIISSQGGPHEFTIFYTDTAGRTTPNTTFSGYNLPFHIDTPISDIHLPPTIEVSRSSLITGETISIFGQAAPGSTIHVIINGNEVFNGVVSGGSDWQYNTNSNYTVGQNGVYAFLTKSGLSNSVNSSTLNFNVTNCRRSDFNCDGQVNLTDFSILLYWWDSNHTETDTNGDGITGLIDFSIMLFDWTD